MGTATVTWLLWLVSSRRVFAVAILVTFKLTITSMGEPEGRRTLTDQQLVHNTVARDETTNLLVSR